MPAAPESEGVTDIMCWEHELESNICVQTTLYQEFYYKRGNSIYSFKDFNH